jgi:GNAT superfamily N-acetyltransferase
MMTITVKDSSFEIRVITQGDLNGVLNLYHRCEDFLALGPEPTASMKMVLNDLALSIREGGIFCGIYASDMQIIGVVDYIPSHVEGNGDFAFLSLLLIAEPFRKRGIGKAIVRAIESEIRENAQIKAILSAVQVNNPAGLQFWQRMGYRIVSGPELRPDQTTVFGLRKDL